MRARVIISLSVGFSLLAVVTPAEVIHLKNGRTIWADHVHENGAHLEYDIGDNNYAIPKSSVERIEAGGIAPPYASSDANAKDLEDLPTLAPVHNFGNQLELIAKIIRDGRVDPDALAVLDQQSDSDTRDTSSPASTNLKLKTSARRERICKRRYGSTRRILQFSITMRRLWFAPGRRPKRFLMRNARSGWHQIPPIPSQFLDTPNLPRIIAATPSAAGSALFRFVPIP